MMIEIDFSSDEAIYIQLTNQIIMGIATSRLQEGDTLPSVRQLADTVGINMHTVNKAYSLLRQEGFVTIDRRRGAVISIDVNKRKALEELKQNLMVALAKGCCKSVTREEVHQLIDEIFDEYDEEETMGYVRRDAYRDGEKAGIEQGLKQGEMLMLISMVNKKMQKGKSIEEIAEDLEEDRETIEKIVKVIEENGHDINAEKVYEMIKGK